MGRIIQTYLSIFGLITLILVGMLGVLRQKPSEAYLIAFYADPHGDAIGGIYQMKIGVQSVQPLTHNFKSLFYFSGLDWSPDGKWIVFAYEDMSGNYQLDKMRADGSDLQNLLTNRGNGDIPRWSPDSQWIVFAMNGDLYMIKPDGSQLQQITHNTLPDWSGAGTWSADSQWIAFFNFRSHDDTQIYKIHPDGSELEIIGDPYFHEPSWSPNGKWIALINDDLATVSIYVLRIDNLDVYRVVSSRSILRYPTWSFDSKWIIFTSTQDGNFEIYRISPDGSNQERLTYTTYDEYTPSASPPFDLPWHTAWLGIGSAIALLLGMGIRRIFR